MLTVLVVFCVAVSIVALFFAISHQQKALTIPAIRQQVVFDLLVNSEVARIEIGVISKEVDLLTARCQALLLNMEQINDLGQPGAGAGTQNKAECAVQSLRPNFNGKTIGV